jgi:hypothetical protein
MYLGYHTRMETHTAEHTPAASDRHTEDDHIAYERIAKAVDKL